MAQKKPVFFFFSVFKSLHVWISCSFDNQVQQPALPCHFSKFICHTNIGLFWTFSVVCVRVWVQKWQNWRPLGPVKPSKVLTASYLQQWCGMMWIWRIVSHQVVGCGGWARTFCESHCYVVIVLWYTKYFGKVFHVCSWTCCLVDLCFYCPCWRLWHWLL